MSLWHGVPPRSQPASPCGVLNNVGASALRTFLAETRFRWPPIPGEPRPVYVCSRRGCPTQSRSVQNELEIWRQTPESAANPCGVRLLVSPNDLESAGDTGDKPTRIVTNSARYETDFPGSCAVIYGVAPIGTLNNLSLDMTARRHDELKMGHKYRVLECITARRFKAWRESRENLIRTETLCRSERRFALAARNW